MTDIGAEVYLQRNNQSERNYVHLFCATTNIKLLKMARNDKILMTLEN